MAKPRTKVVPEMPGFITEAVLAGRIGVSEKSMWRKRRLGQAPVATIIGRQIFYSDADVAYWVAKCRQTKPPSRARRMKSARRVSLGRSREGRAA
jgi:hypothetical protein